MTALGWLAVVVAALAILAALVLFGLFVRRLLLQRDGGFDMCLRIGPEAHTYGWVFGVGRYQGELLEWHRTFWLGSGAKRVLNRRRLTVVRRREPTDDEQYDLPAGQIVFECEIGGERVEVSMPEAAATGFRSWLEAAPPGEYAVV
jgi:hypothetical protein